jgi:hypothetical protein
MTEEHPSVEERQNEVVRALRRFRNRQLHDPIDHMTLSAMETLRSYYEWAQRQLEKAEDIERQRRLLEDEVAVLNANLATARNRHKLTSDRNISLMNENTRHNQRSREQHRTSERQQVTITELDAERARLAEENTWLRAQLEDRVAKSKPSPAVAQVERLQAELGEMQERRLRITEPAPDMATELLTAAARDFRHLSPPVQQKLIDHAIATK